MDSIIFDITDTASFEDGITGLTWLENNLSAYDPLEEHIALDDLTDEENDDALIDDEDVFH